MSCLVAIHQPNFFPWPGYFDKIRQADVFVFLDAVDYPRSGSGGMGSWINRVKLGIQGQARWITCPLRRMPLGSPINAAVIDDSQPWRKKMLKTLDANYRKAPNYERAIAVLKPLIEERESYISPFNINAIKTIAAGLGLETRFVLQSELTYEGRATELLISLVKSVGGDQYLAGGGAGGYQQDDLFFENGVELVYQNYAQPSYGPTDKFIPGLSIIDYLMHDGGGWNE